MRATVVASAMTLLAPMAPAQALEGVGHPHRGSSWLVDELAATNHFDYPGGWGADYGLTIDTAFALAATGNRNAKLNKVAADIEANYWDTYIQYAGTFYAASSAKALVAARVLRRPATSFGGHDLRAQVLSMVADETDLDTAAAEFGHVRDGSWNDPEFPADYSNSIGQSFAVLGLARSGGAPQSTVDFLLRQQCASGGFTLYLSTGKTCDEAGSTGDVDTTGIALQALLAAWNSGSAIPGSAVRRAAEWLVSVQKNNGGFAAFDGSGRANANSTGYAAAGLRAANRDGAAERAAEFASRLQLPTGAIAFDLPAKRDAVTNGIAEEKRDQFRRATSQGLLALIDRTLVGLRRS
jgi:hypothetical protein